VRADGKASARPDLSHSKAQERWLCRGTEHTDDEQDVEGESEVQGCGDSRFKLHSCSGQPRGEAASWGGHGRTFFGTDGPDGEGILEGHSGNGARPRGVSRKGSRPATEPPTPDKIAGSGQRLVVSSRDAQHHGWSVGSGTRRTAQSLKGLFARYR
jgi:hypothetical protein